MLSIEISAYKSCCFFEAILHFIEYNKEIWSRLMRLNLFSLDLVSDMRKAYFHPQSEI